MCKSFSSRRQEKDEAARDLVMCLFITGVGAGVAACMAALGLLIIGVVVGFSTLASETLMKGGLISMVGVSILAVSVFLFCRALARHVVARHVLTELNPNPPKR